MKVFWLLELTFLVRALRPCRATSTAAFFFHLSPSFQLPRTSVHVSLCPCCAYASPFLKGGDYKNVVVWLHGLGDTASGWSASIPEFRMPNTKFILPTAPERYTRTWFPVEKLVVYACLHDKCTQDL